MASERQIRANRANARRSTGPKTSRGRAISSRNSLRHGLEITTAADPILSEAVEAITDIIAGADATPDLRHLASRIAEAQVELIRARNFRLQRLAPFLRRETQELDAIVERIDRYEKRALSRRKFAVRAFDAAQQKDRRPR